MSHKVQPPIERKCSTKPIDIQAQGVYNVSINSNFIIYVKTGRIGTAL
jgi:hypothetical protein